MFNFPYVNGQTLTPLAFQINSRKDSLGRNVIAPPSAFPAEFGGSAVTTTIQSINRNYEQAIMCMGLGPYRLCHLSARPSGDDLVIGWIRRTRVDGDSWSAFEVPLGEESELYLLSILEGGNVLL